MDQQTDVRSSHGATPDQSEADAIPRPRGHGRVERGLDAVARHPEGFGRFGRMFPELAPARFGKKREDEQALMFEIAKTMIQLQAGPPAAEATIVEAEPSDENPDITAGYTYFGQFVDHDITFDTASDLDRDNDPGGVEDFRTARLDLDSIYGRGPDDQPYLYNPDLTIKLGADKTPDYLRDKGKKRFDVQRAPQDESGEFIPAPDHCARAIIGDPRNDENNLVVQIHALWQRFHNKIMAGLAEDKFDEEGDLIREGLKGMAAFNTAQRQVRWHYQWVVLHDFLRKIVGDETFHEVYNDGDPVLRFYNPAEADFPFMPVEFSVAAYRFGHSMVRPTYSLSARIPHTIAGTLDRIPIFSPNFACRAVDSLNGFRPLVPEWGLDWHFFLPGINTPLPASTPELPFEDFKVPQPSYRIDTVLVDPLKDLPDHKGLPEQRRSLPSLNLLRGLALGLPSGQAVARRMNIRPLTDAELWTDEGNLEAENLEARREVFKAHKQELHNNAPLWYYILREAELADPLPTNVDGETVMLGGRHLGEVGGRIVAEVLIGLVLADNQSFLVQNPAWTPTLPITPDGSAPTDDTPEIGPALTLADIVRFVDQAA